MKKVQYKGIFLILIVYVVISYLCSAYILNFFTLFIHPIALIILAIGCNRFIGISRGKNSKVLTQNMIIVMLTYFIIYELLGIVLGFVRNPYSIAPLSVLKNLWSIVVPIVCIEYIRDLVVNNNSKSSLGITLSVILFALIEVNLYTMSINMIEHEKTFVFICSILIPNLANQLIYTFLTLKGSYKLVLTERILYQIIILFTPILPNLNWFSSGILGIVFPSILYFVFKFYFDKKARYVKRSRVKNNNPIHYIPIVILIFFLAGFVLGVFKYTPVSVASNSMNKLFYRGDVVVYKRIDEDILQNLEIKDIIVFKRDNKIVIHRIAEIIEQDGKLYFRTKGDNNMSIDFQVVREVSVIGKYEFHVKYIGYPSVWLSELLKKQK